MSGTFITFEGIEGCGKTTQIRMLKERLQGGGREVLLTREPGGTPIGDRIRAVLLDAAHEGMVPLTELFLYAAARSQHVEQVIRPALKKGTIVLCDRYADATTAYQGAARQIDAKVVSEAIRLATDGLMPDLTILLDCPAEVGLGRATARNLKDKTSKGEDRFEREEMSFHRRVRDGYLAIARAEPGRVSIIDASRNDIDAIQRNVIEKVESVLHFT